MKGICKRTIYQKQKKQLYQIILSCSNYSTFNLINVWDWHLSRLCFRNSWNFLNVALKKLFWESMTLTWKCGETHFESKIHYNTSNSNLIEYLLLKFLLSGCFLCSTPIIVNFTNQWEFKICQADQSLHSSGRTLAPLKHCVLQSLTIVTTTCLQIMGV